MFLFLLLFQKFWACFLCLMVKVLSSFLFEEEAKVEEIDEEDFEDNILVRKFNWTYDNLLKFENHLMSKQILFISQFGKIENLV